jgi:capsular exopolysaccharide synthesis family protein
MPEPRSESRSTRTPDWLQPPVEQEGLQRYAETLRERARLIQVVTLVVTVVSVIYVLLAPKMYEAEADLLITPVQPENGALTSLGLITESADPTRNVETAARLATTLDVAVRARRILHTGRTPRSLLAGVRAEPVAQSNIVAITAEAGTPAAARDLANAFGEAAVALRTDTLHERIEQAIPGLRAQLEEQGGRGAGNGRDALSAELAQLQLLRGAPDPTFRLETKADLPRRQSSPRPLLSIAGGIIAGLVFGVAAAFGLQALDPRLRREEQLRRLYRLPILARIPRESREKVGANPIGPQALSSPAAEAYRMLRTTLTGSRDDGSRTILVTGPSASEGKTTTAINLASSLALAGNKVILIDADLRRPSLATALGVNAEHGVVSVLIENVKLGDALVETSIHGLNLSVLVADYTGSWIADLFALPAAQQLIEDAKKLADYVIIDSPPLNEVVDAMPMARRADDLLIVVRLDSSRLDKIAQLGELMAENEIRPTGFVVVGTQPSKASSYYHPDESNRRLQS